jgi:hypothetical protein
MYVETKESHQPLYVSLNYNKNAKNGDLICLLNGTCTLPRAGSIFCYVSTEM